MSAGERVAARYRGVSTAQLRQLLGLMRNERRKAAVEIVLTERQDAYQTGYDTAQVLLDVVGGDDAKNLHAKALATSMRHVDASQYREAEQAMGFADALWEYLQERADT